MKKLLLLIMLIAGALRVLSQTELTKANECFDKKDYQCAADNYKIALDKKGYKEDQRYLVEYRIGYCYSSQEQYGMALEYLNKSLVSKPGYYSSYWEMGNVYYNTGKFLDAVTYYKKAYDGTPSSADKETITWWLARSYYKQKNYTSAIPEFKKILSRQGTFIEADVFIADAFYFLKKYDSAITYYKKTLTLYKPDDATAKSINSFIGKCYRELGRNKEANDQQDALLALDPAFANAMWEKGILSANKKDYQLAIDWYKKSLPSYTKDSSDTYTLMNNITACYLNLSNFAEAVNWQMKKKPYSKNKYNEILKIASLQYSRLKQRIESEKTCNEGIAQYALETAERQKSLQNIEYVSFHNILGKINLERKDTTKALIYFEKAYKLNSSSYEANAGLAEIAWARKKDADYKKYFINIYKTTYDTLITTRKEIANVYGRAAHTDAWISKLTYYSSNVESALQFDSLQKEAVLLWPMVLNQTSWKLASYRKACISLLNKAAKYYAADKSYVSDVYNSIAVMYETKDTTAIRLALLEAVKANPENIKAWDNLMKYYTSYDSQAGVLAVEKLIAILKKQKDNATTATAYVYKGDFLWRLVKKEVAKKAWQEALVWDAGNATAKERIKLE